MCFFKNNSCYFKLIYPLIFSLSKVKSYAFKFVTLSSFFTKSVKLWKNIFLKLQLCKENYSRKKPNPQNSLYFEYYQLFNLTEKSLTSTGLLQCTMAI